ncbi:bifunctional proline dehydrogenase/L-glutamate gamma-semialdehyde dehydrogenase [Mumia sp. zg.B17]|uniref:bifunctional proline dehydrogenase/L-glutamate gamma-semialdehyde dehydrogenase n=1 Tax=Mumia sp. zg.B17 TaxID=2855446 RepID=UPI001C6E0A62|nr:bifunctional proline dehydrogenase/L-glutamate gamma-semialdehyde dehydrogenase [Mumia sp. zg.B17]MBW9207123.1 bifunctional proline dehydrogenase/L-glutamate gamma-semialdehyde dehydrogenase [Mumia sp. zg.B17]
MTSTTETDALATDLSDEVESLVRQWLDTARDIPADRSAEQLAAVLKDPKGLPFAVGFVDGVIRPEDPRVAAQAFADLAGDLPRFLPLHLRTAVKAGAVAARVAPGLVIPVVRRVLRAMVGHLVVDASDRRLGPAISRIRSRGVRLNVNLLGEAVLGEREAARRLDGTHRLLARDDVDYVSIKVSSTVAPHSPFAFDETVDHVVEQLRPLYRRAAAASPQKFINLDMEEYRDLDLTVAVFTRLLDEPELLDLEGGIVLQAYLPDTLATMAHLQDWAAARRARGGAGIKVRLVKGANLPMETVEASVRDWPLATWGSKQETDTHYKRILDYALHPDRIANVRLGVAGHNLFDIAFAWLLAGRRGVRDGVDFEMLLGMAQGQAEAVRRTVGDLLLYTPVVRASEFDTAIAYLVRRLEEGASQENFMSAVFDLDSDERLFARERARFLASLRALDATVPEPNRRQDRRTDSVPVPPAGFENTPDTDPALPGNRKWARDILDRATTTTRGEDLVRDHTVTSPEALESIVAAAVGAQPAWSSLGGDGRAEVLRQAAAELERRRADLVEVMAAECGKTIDQADPEVSEAIDFARFYAESAAMLDRTDGARPVPVRLTVVTPPWNFPVAIPAGSMLAALASGSSVVVKPAPQAQRCGSLVVEALWAAGVPRDVLHLAHVEESDLGRRLVSDPRVDRLILTGAYETAELFRTFRPDLPLLAETSGKNAIIVTPSADLDLAVKDLVASAFGHAGQKCSAASLAILVGPIATSRRFRDQLADTVRSLKVGYPTDATSQVGPVIEPVHGKLRDALTSLETGESWLVEPHQLDADQPDGGGRLWSPGVKVGVAPGSQTHLVEFFGPVLGIMTAATLEEAIALQNAPSYGLTAGIHSLDPHEIATWVDGVQAGNLYVNRGITGAIVRRQPFGGWKRSAVGAGTKAGGPSYLHGLVDWEPAEATATDPVLDVQRPFLESAGAAGAAVHDLRTLERALRSDAAAWRTELGSPTDVTGIPFERNVLRHLPVPVTVRYDGSRPLVELIRVVAAGALTGSTISASSAVPLPDAVRAAFGRARASVVVEPEDAWFARAAELPSGRVRLVGGDAAALARATGGRPDLAVYGHAVTEAGRVELLPFLHEQAVSMTAHRFGTLDGLTEQVLPTV